MKKYLIILCIIACISANTSAQNWKKGLAVAGYHMASVAVGAIGDAQYDMNNKDLGHLLKATEVGMIIGGPFIFHIQRLDALSYILSYGFIRFATFDSFYNLTRDLPLLYNGTTSVYDRTMSKMPDFGKAWYKSFSLIVGFAIPIKEIR